MKYVIHKKVINEQIKALRRRGGPFQKAAEKVMSLSHDLEHKLSKDPLKSFNTTNHGESRVNKCVKYDLNAACRLLTIKDSGVHAIVYLGDHDECDKWLNTNKGYVLTLSEDNQLIDLKVTEKVTPDSKRSAIPKNYNDTLLESLSNYYLEMIQDNMRASVYKKIEKIDSFTNEDEIIEICATIRSEPVQSMVLDVLLELREVNIDEAKNRILLFKQKLDTLENIEESRIEKIQSSENFILLEDFEASDIKRLIKETEWYDWMLFMHPSQRNMVKKDFTGSARLLGVSGSGKTCVAVKRVVRLAKKYPQENILITTINDSLADLIKDLINIVIREEDDEQDLKKRIHAKSFWQVCKEIIEEHENDEYLLRSLDKYTDKNLENIDEVWSEYYLCKNNNSDAQVFDNIQKTLNSRNIHASEYLRQELDWIRSAVFPDKRNSYLKIDREGRFIPLNEEYRKSLLQGLEKWEKKMMAVGVSDYLGLLKNVYKYRDKIKPKYRCVVVDELQDFGTTELFILRQLVRVNENDLFLCGDIAQQVQTKSQKITQANIRIQPNNYNKIVKNYRNSREILEAASKVFENNTTEEQYKSEGFELLKPEYANFSSPKPFIRICNSLKEEIEYAISYLEENLEAKQKACIAIAGWSFFQVSALGKLLSVKVLDGIKEVKNDSLFISDLNQTKGFEFDKIIIINCSNNIFPDPNLPEEEHYKEISKLYVAMTRAKNELIITYSKNLSKIFQKSLNYFNTITKWEQYTQKKNISQISIDEFQNLITDSHHVNKYSIKGYSYLKLKEATGLSLIAQEKINSVISGKNITFNGKQVQWSTLKEFLKFLNNTSHTPQMSKILGKKILYELRTHFKNQ